jgi:hypothetical protein
MPHGRVPTFTSESSLLVVLSMTATVPPRPVLT